ncbi:MAG: hypothetical protein WA188_07800 [Terriglobales bacterium]
MKIAAFYSVGLPRAQRRIAHPRYPSVTADIATDRRHTVPESPDDRGLGNQHGRAQNGISFGACMNFPVTLATKSDQVLLGIRTLTAPESVVMNFDCGKRAASLAAPAIALQYLLA